MDLMKFLPAKKIQALIALVIVMIAGYFGINNLFVAKQDYFECAPGNTLVVCPVGETPTAPQECRAVGSGDTSMTEGNCS